MKKNDVVLQKVRLIEDKNYIFYARTDGRAYKILKVIFTVFFAYTVFNNAIYAVGSLIVGKNYLSEILKPVLTAVIGTVMLIAGFVFLNFKKHIVSFLLTAVSSIGMIPLFADLLKDETAVNTYLPKFYWRHLIPLLALAILSLILTVIALRADIKTRKLYKSVVDSVREVYGADLDNGGELTDSQWDEFLKKYDPLSYRLQFKSEDSKSE